MDLAKLSCNGEWNTPRTIEVYRLVRGVLGPLRLHRDGAEVFADKCAERGVRNSELVRENEELRDQVASVEARIARLNHVCHHCGIVQRESFERTKAYRRDVHIARESARLEALEKIQRIINNVRV